MARTAAPTTIKRRIAVQIAPYSFKDEEDARPAPISSGVVVGSEPCESWVAHALQGNGDGIICGFSLNAKVDINNDFLSCFKIRGVPSISERNKAIYNALKILKGPQNGALKSLFTTLNISSSASKGDQAGFVHAAVMRMLGEPVLIPYSNREHVEACLAGLRQETDSKRSIIALNSSVLQRHNLLLFFAVMKEIIFSNDVFHAPAEAEINDIAKRNGDAFSKMLDDIQADFIDKSCVVQKVDWCDVYKHVTEEAQQEKTQYLADPASLPEDLLFILKTFVARFFNQFLALAAAFHQVLPEDYLNIKKLEEVFPGFLHLDGLTSPHFNDYSAEELLNSDNDLVQLVINHVLDYLLEERIGLAKLTAGRNFAYPFTYHASEDKQWPTCSERLLRSIRETQKQMNLPCMKPYDVGFLREHSPSPALLTPRSYSPATTTASASPSSDRTSQSVSPVPPSIVSALEVAAEENKPREPRVMHRNSQKQQQRISIPATSAAYCVAAPASPVTMNANKEIDSGYNSGSEGSEKPAEESPQVNLVFVVEAGHSNDTNSVRSASTATESPNMDDIYYDEELQKREMEMQTLQRTIESAVKGGVAAIIASAPFLKSPGAMQTLMTSLFQAAIETQERAAVAPPPRYYPTKVMEAVPELEVRTATARARDIEKGGRPGHRRHHSGHSHQHMASSRPHHLQPRDSILAQVVSSVKDSVASAAADPSLSRTEKRHSAPPSLQRR